MDIDTCCYCCVCKLSYGGSHSCSICKFPCHTSCCGPAGPGEDDSCSQLVCFNCSSDGVPIASDQSLTSDKNKKRDQAKEEELQLQDQMVVGQTRKCRRKNDAITKLEAIELAKATSIRSVAAKYGMDRSSVREWMRKEEAIRQQVDSSGGSTRKRLNGGGRPVQHTDIDNELAEWVREMRENGRPISRRIISEKAKQLFSGTNLKISNGWLGKFLKRHDFVLRDRTATATGAQESPSWANQLSSREIIMAMEPSFKEDGLTMHFEGDGDEDRIECLREEEEEDIGTQGLKILREVKAAIVAQRDAREDSLPIQLINV